MILYYLLRNVQQIIVQLIDKQNSCILFLIRIKYFLVLKK